MRSVRSGSVAVLAAVLAVSACGGGQHVLVGFAATNDYSPTIPAKARIAHATVSWTFDCAGAASMGAETDEGAAVPIASVDGKGSGRTADVDLREATTLRVVCAGQWGATILGS